MMVSPLVPDGRSLKFSLASVFIIIVNFLVFLSSYLIRYEKVTDVFVTINEFEWLGCFAIVFL